MKEVDDLPSMRREGRPEVGVVHCVRGGMLMRLRALLGQKRRGRPKWMVGHGARPLRIHHLHQSKMRKKTAGWKGEEAAR